MAAVEKIEDQRKPEDFFGYRNRIAPYGMGAADSSINIYLTYFNSIGAADTSVIHYSLLVISF